MQWEDCKKKLAKMLWLTCRPLNIKKESYLDLCGFKNKHITIDFGRLESYSTAMTEEEPLAVLSRKNVEETG